MRTSNLFLTLASLAAAGLAACSDTTTHATGTTGASSTATSGGTTTGATTSSGTTNGGTTTGGGTSSTGGSSTTGGDAGLPGFGLPCNPTVAPDPCTTYSLGCDINPADRLADGGSTCALPIEQAACDPAIGCATGNPPELHCVSGFGAGMSPSTCVFYCDASADCPTAVTSCQAPPSGSQQVCLFNFCGPGTIAGGQYFAPCSSNATGDGTCDPFVRLSATTDLGICDPGGGAGLWQACSFARTPGGNTAALCAQNSTCVSYNAPNGLRQFCAPVCSPPGSLASGPSCATGQTCLPFASPDFGICLADCGAGQTCPASTVCQALQISATQTIQECVVN